MKNTKKSLLTSALCLLLCMSMLVGTTFAWFTDSVESLNNKIVAGNLDVELYNALPGNLTPDTKVEDGGLFEEITYWEPGVVAYENLTIANEGTLALKYALSVNFDNENTLNGYGLSDKLQVAFVPDGLADGMSREKVIAAADKVGFNPMASFAQNGKLLPAENDHITEIDKTGIPVETVTYAIVIYWEPSDDDNSWNANNGQETSDKQALHIDLGVNLFATQMVAEDDSFGPDYDEAAEYVIGAGESFVYAGATLDGTVENKGTVELSNGTTIEFDGIGLENYGNATLENVTVNAGTPGTNAYGYAINSGAGANTVLNNVVVDAKNGAIGATNGAQVTINSGSIAVNSQNTSGRYNIYAVGEDTVVTVNGGEYSFSASLNQKRSYVYAADNATVIINGGTFGKASTRSGYPGIKTDGTATVIITGGTFGFDPTEWVADGYKATQYGAEWIVTADGVYPATPANIQSVINAAQAGDIISLTAGEYHETIVMKSDVTLQGSEGAVVDCINLNGADNVTLKGITFDAAGAQGAYDKGGKLRQYANIMGANNTTNKGASNVVIDGCTFTGTYANGGVAIAFADQSRKSGQSGDITIKNCTFATKGTYYDIYTYYSGKGIFVIENNTFASECLGKPIYLGRYQSSTPVVVKGNVFVNEATFGDAAYIQSHESIAVSFDAADNTFGG